MNDSHHLTRKELFCNDQAYLTIFCCFAVILCSWRVRSGFAEGKNVIIMIGDGTRTVESSRRREAVSVIALHFIPAFVDENTSRDGSQCHDGITRFATKRLTPLLSGL